MRGGPIPPALISAAMGLALSFVRPRVAQACLLLFASSALIAAAAPAPPLSDDWVFTACWISVLVSAASVHLPSGLGPRVAIILALNSGVWAGLVGHYCGAWDLAAALPWVLLWLPGVWLRRRGWGLAVKVAASWLIAIAGLEALLALVPTPGYRPDHMD